MARTVKLNPDDARNLGRDVDDVIHGSGSAIDAVYAEYKEMDRAVADLESLLDNLKANDQTVPRNLRIRIAEKKARRRELDRRIAQYGRVMVKRMKERLTLVENSPGAAFNQKKIAAAKRLVFKIERKSKDRGADIRNEVARAMGAIITLEQDSGIVVRRPGQKVSQLSQRKAQEAEFVAAAVAEWQKVRRHAKKDPRLEEDVEWIDAQLRSIPIKFRRGESVRRDIARVMRRIKDVHNRSKPRKQLKTYAQARKGLRDFVVAIGEYSQEDVTAAGVDRIQNELEKFARQFTPKAKAEWKKEDARQFATDLRKVRKGLDMLRPKRGRKKNPCVGLHFHGKDADDLLKALEGSAERQTKKVKKNPSKKKKGPVKKAAAKTKKAAKKATRAVKKVAKKTSRSTKSAVRSFKKTWKKNPASLADAYAIQIQRMDTAELRRERKKWERWIEKSEDPVKEFGRTGLKTLKNAIAHADRELASRARKANPADTYTGLARWLGTREAAESTDQTKLTKSEKMAILLEACEEERYGHCTPAEFRKAKAIIGRQANPKKKASKKSTRKKATPATTLIKRCQKLWETYCEKPTKKNLRAVLAHLDKMKESKAESVKKERSRCLRVANKEAKRLKMK